MDDKQKILEAYIATISEAPLSDKHGSVMSFLGDVSGLITKINNSLKKQDPHWPDVVMNIKKAAGALQKAQKAAK